MGFVHCNLRVLMAERGLNIQNVKDKTSLSRTTISNLYNNLGSGIQFDTLGQLCSLLRCNPADLLTFVNIKLKFEDITTNTEVNILNKDNENEKDFQPCNVTATLTLKTEISLEEQEVYFEFGVEVVADLDENMNIIHLDKIITKDYRFNLNKLNPPIYVEDYIDDQLDLFLINWIHSYIETKI